jgi:putative FmdB family regulatory protein
MPIYEYNCKECGKDSEILVRGDTTINCRNCGSEKIERKLSTFSFSSLPAGGTQPSCASACGGGYEGGACGSGGCCGGH